MPTDTKNLAHRFPDDVTKMFHLNAVGERWAEAHRPWEDGAPVFRYNPESLMEARYPGSTRLLSPMQDSLVHYLRSTLSQIAQAYVSGIEAGIVIGVEENGWTYLWPNPALMDRLRQQIINPSPGRLRWGFMHVLQHNVSQYGDAWPMIHEFLCVMERCLEPERLQRYLMECHIAAARVFAVWVGDDIRTLATNLHVVERLHRRDLRVHADMLDGEAYLQENASDGCRHAVVPMYQALTMLWDLCLRTQAFRLRSLGATVIKQSIGYPYIVSFDGGRTTSNLVVSQMASTEIQRGHGPAGLVDAAILAGDLATSTSATPIDRDQIMITFWKAVLLFLQEHDRSHPWEQAPDDTKVLADCASRVDPPSGDHAGPNLGA